MKQGKFLTNTHGFTLVEILVTISLILVLGGLAIYNFSVFKISSYDATALSDYRNIQTVIRAADSNSEQPLSYIIFNEVGPIELPPPLNTGKLSKNIHLQYLIKINLLGLIDLLTLQLTHDNGDNIYRLTEVNGNLSEQVFSK